MSGCGRLTMAVFWMARRRSCGWAKCRTNGEPKDHSAPGHEGECDIAFVEVYGAGK